MKNMKWFKKKLDDIEVNTTSLQNHDAIWMLNRVHELYDQLDDPEVLSQEWIERRKTLQIMDDGKETYVILEDDWQNLLVPKQELPVIPKFVADWYEEHKDTLENQLRGIAFNLDKYGEMPEVNDLDKWINKTESPLQTLASLKFGYEVEKEQKYYVVSTNDRMMLVRMMDGETIAEAVPYEFENVFDSVWKSYQLTEQEIKDYDIRYWPFRVKVKELEE